MRGEDAEMVKQLSKTNGKAYCAYPVHGSSRGAHSKWKDLLLFVIVLTTLVGCDKSPSQNSVQRNPESNEKITFAYTYQPQSTLAHVATSKAYFKEEGLDVQPLMRSFGKEALQALLENKAEFATVAETPVMFSGLKGDKIFVIANIETSSTNDAVVARKTAGINAPGDLKGKRVGFTPGTTSDFFLDSFLTANGLTRQDIQPVALKPDEMQEAMTAKTVDAVSAWNYPLTLIAQKLGNEAVVFYDKLLYTETFNIVAQQDFVKAKPETVKSFLRALIKAEDFVAKNPDEAQTIMAAATKMDKKLIRDVWNAFNYRVVLDQKLLLTLEDEARWAIKNKHTDKTVMPDYSSYIHSDSLRAVRPEAVSTNR